MRILMPVVHFDLLSGSSIHVYELARILAGRGHDVTVTAPDIGGQITERARRNGVDVVDLEAMTRSTYDLIHAHQHDVGLAAMARVPSVPVVATLHSRAAADRPIASSRVRRYVCVRPEIRSHAVACHRVPEACTTVVFNGIDRTRFRPAPSAVTAHVPPRVLFIGTVMARRRAAFQDLVARTERDGRDLRVVGIGPDDWLATAPDHVTWARREVWAVEDEIQAAAVVAAIALSRTAIEAWACGKPALVYELDDTAAGRIVSAQEYAPPPPAVMAVFDIEHMATELERVYEAAA
jgi:glycosyltransferase involved in cell wall biosynthesis